MRITADRGILIHRLLFERVGDAPRLESIDKSSEIQVLLEVHRLALHVRVRGDLVRDTKLIQHLALNCSPAVTRVRVEFNLQYISFDHIVMIVPIQFKVNHYKPLKINDLCNLLILLGLIHQLIHQQHFIKVINGLRDFLTLFHKRTGFIVAPVLDF